MEKSIEPKSSSSDSSTSSSAEFEPTSAGLRQYHDDISPFDFEFFRMKTKNGKRAFVRLNRKTNRQLDTIMKDLVLLETHLRQEQSRILSILAHRDMTICDQQQEIEKLRRDNRRLILRIKKITEERRVEGEDAEKGSGTSECKYLSKISNSSSQHFIGADSASQIGGISLLTSQFYEKTALHYTDQNGKLMERVLHKPPIAKKPMLGRNFQAQFQGLNHPIAAVIQRQNGQNNIVSTIGRLLEEDSDQMVTESSSEPSSPDTTLKPSSMPPRVLKLAQLYEKVLNSSVTSGRRRCYKGQMPQIHEQQTKTMMILDEHEVTSGYNSDAISDPDPDYENVVVLRDKVTELHPEGEKDSEEESDDNYVTLRAGEQLLKETLVDSENETHIYCNINYINGEAVEHSETDTDGPLSRSSDTGISVDSSEISLDSLETPYEYSLCSDIAAKNVPRSRHNINLIMESGFDGNAHLMDNFEEFSLDSLDLEDGSGDYIITNLSSDFRHAGDGAEAKNLIPLKEQAEPNTGGQSGYERFLEVTGLSQKSILTPSRMFSNHRSVLKPRDIKNRDKLRAVITSLSTVAEMPSSTTQVQKYWQEPYL